MNHKNFANSGPSASNFKTFSWSLEHFFSHRRSEQFVKQNTFSHLRLFKSYSWVSWEQFWNLRTTIGSHRIGAYQVGTWNPSFSKDLERFWVLEFSKLAIFLVNNCGSLSNKFKCLAYETLPLKHGKKYLQN